MEVKFTPDTPSAVLKMFIDYRSWMFVSAVLETQPISTTCRFEEN